MYSQFIRSWLIVATGCALSIFLCVGIASAQTPPDPGAVNDQVEQTVEGTIGRPIPDFWDVEELAVNRLNAAKDPILHRDCEAYAFAPRIVAYFLLQADVEFNCSLIHDEISVVGVIQVKIAGSWHQLGPPSPPAANSGVNDVQTTITSHCIEGRWNYRSRAQGQAEPGAHFDVSRSPKTSLVCRDESAMSAEEFLATLD